VAVAVAASQVPASHAAPTAVDVDGQAILDPSVFDEARQFLAEEADEVIGRLLESFHAKTPDMVSDLRRAAEKRDCQNVRFIAHTLKGLSGTVGARRVQALCAEIEASAASEPNRDTTPTVSRLEAELVAARRALSASLVDPTEATQRPVT
jgi:HPt (histidine-containing phosphotransfer) domain-containing protein